MAIITNYPTAPTIVNLPAGMTFTQWQAIQNNVQTATNLKQERRAKFWQEVKAVGLPLLQSILGIVGASKFGAITGGTDVTDAQIDNYYAKGGIQQFQSATTTEPKLLGFTYQQIGLGVGLVGIGLSIYSLVKNSSKNKNKR